MMSPEFSVKSAPPSADELERRRQNLGGRRELAGNPMDLSAELFQSVVQALRVEDAGDRADPSHSALRDRRVRLAGHAIVIPCTGEFAGEPLEAVARDVSPSGIALTLSLRLVHGDRFILHLPSACGCRLGAMSGYSILCTVARYQHTDDALYTLGATFVRVLGDSIAQPHKPAANPI
jgi:hypothetical protein